MADRAGEFERLGFHILAVSMSPATGLARYLAMRPWPFPVLADPDRQAYAAFGIGKTTWARIFRPGVIGKYLRLIWHGSKVRRIPEGEDALQLGGDFLVSRDRRLIWGYVGADPTDRPAVSDMVQEARRAVDSGPVSPY